MASKSDQAAWEAAFQKTSGGVSIAQANTNAQVAAYLQAMAAAANRPSLADQLKAQNGGDGTYTGPGADTPGGTGGDASYQDALYQAKLAALQQAYANQIAGIGAEENATANTYGYLTKRDPVTGALSIDTSVNGGVDPNNPFSKATLLTKSYQQAQTGNTTGLAAQGQLYSGALQNAQNNAGDQYQQGENTLQTGFQAALRDFINQRYTAQANLASGNLDALGEAITRHSTDTTTPTVGTALGGTPTGGLGSVSPVTGVQAKDTVVGVKPQPITGTSAWGSQKVKGLTTGASTVKPKNLTLKSVLSKSGYGMPTRI